MKPEAVILLINLSIVMLAYLYVYPRMAGYDLKKIALNDVVATLLALLIAASLFQGSGVEFSMLGIRLNWFWFSLITYIVIEVPFMLWYFKKFFIWKS